MNAIISALSLRTLHLELSTHSKASIYHQPTRALSKLFTQVQAVKALNQDKTGIIIDLGGYIHVQSMLLENVYCINATIYRVILCCWIYKVKVLSRSKLETLPKAASYQSACLHW